MCVYMRGAYVRERERDHNNIEVNANNLKK